MSTNTVIRGCGFHHAAIQTTNFEAAKAFYRDVMGCRVAHECDIDVRKLCLLDLGDGSHIEIIGIPQSMVPAGPTQAFPLVHIALRVDDVDAAVDRVRAAGRPLTMEPKDVSLGTMPVRVAFFDGPSGESVELFQVK